MPELPEVEAVAQSLLPLVCGRKIERCEVIHKIAMRPQKAATLYAGAEGQRIVDVERRGKYLLLRLERGVVVMHFRLDGQLVWFDAGRVSGHIDVALHLPKGTLGFVDRRHFGRVNFYETPQDSAGLRSLGDEPLGPAFTWQRLAELLGGSRRPVKLFLMDQTRIAGLGNIYSNEALWRARLDSRRRTNRLSAVETRRLHKGIVDVLRRALECCLNPAPNFRDPEWWFQGLEKILGVYGREGKRCRRCGERIRRIAQGARSSYFCPGCQR